MKKDKDNGTSVTDQAEPRLRSAREYGSTPGQSKVVIRADRLPA